MFGAVAVRNDGVILNCHVVKGSITGVNGAGWSSSLGLIASSNYGEIKYCLVEDSRIEVYYNSSGIIGNNYGLMEGCCGLSLVVGQYDYTRKSCSKQSKRWHY